MSSQVRNLATQAKLLIERARARWAAVDVAVGTLKRFSADDGSSYAAALTYYTFFSIFPLLVFGIAALGYLTFGNAELQDDILNAGLETIPMLRDALSPNGLETIKERRQELALTGIVLTLYSGSGAVVALEHALNKLWRITEEPKFVQKRLRSLVWLAILGGAAVTSLALSAVARALGSLVGALPGLGEALGIVLLHGMGIAVGTLVFAAAYRVLPAKDLAWTAVLPGAIVAATAFEVLKSLGATYLRAGAASRNATFGSFATAAGLLVASYLLSQITLLSAEVNVVLADRRATRQSVPDDPKEAK
jgi:YihY family inner membrane protein